MIAAPSKRLLSLCTIVRDNARTIRPCLESIRPWVDEMVVVDTGSVDETPTICEQLGATIHSFPWVDDFAAARNESLRHAMGDWIFWMDSDDTIPSTCGSQLRELVEGPHPANRLGYVMQVHCPGPDGVDSPDMTVVDHVKLFRNLPQVQFEGRIHEQIIPSIRRAGGDIGWTDIFVVHSGAEHTPQARQRKYERDLRLLRLELRERPNHPFVLFNLGMTFNDMEQHEEAVGWLKRCIEVSYVGESHLRKAYALLLASLTQLRRYAEAQSVSQDARSRFPKDPELHFREGILAHSQGRLLDAANAYVVAINNDDQRHFSSIDPGISGHKARHNLALVYQEMKRHDLAEFQWRLAKEERARFRPGLVALAQSLMREGRLAAAATEIEQLAEDTEFEAEAGVLTAELQEREGQKEQAREQLDALANRFHDRWDVHEARCRFLFHQGSPLEAEAALSLMVQRFPEDGAAWQNLASIQLAQGKSSDAILALRRSLQVRPHATQTRRQLEQLLVEESRHGR